MRVKPKRLPVVTNKTLAILREHLEEDGQVEISLDLGLSQTVVEIKNKEVILPSGEKFTIPASFDPKNNVCYFIKGGQLFPLQMFDPERNFAYQLAPTSFRPILRISATQMHKKPFLDRLEKERLTGSVLDGGTGLGYSAIIASRTASEVITIEWDPNVIEMATYNPHSATLFEAENIKLIQGDITTEIKQFENQRFDNIIQDGGMPKSSGRFFSQSHAHQLFRVLKRGGRLFFYLPRKGIKSGRDFGREQVIRMRNAGFKLIERDIDGSYAIFRK